jgi:hypothetical protein
LDELAQPESGAAQAGALPRGGARTPSRPTLLHRLLGSRPPRVHLQLVRRENGSIAAHPCVEGRSPGTRAALAELAALVEFVFAQGQGVLTAAEWGTLLGEQPASAWERLILLTRLAIPPDTQVPLAAAPPFAPDDRTLDRYHAKFAALPDGLPFSLRLLLADGRGARAKRDADAAFLALPEAVLLLGLRRTLAAEEREGQHWDDAGIGPPLRAALAELGVTLPMAPSARAVQRLRERWGAEVFPNVWERKRQQGRCP